MVTQRGCSIEKDDFVDVVAAKESAVEGGATLKEKALDVAPGQGFEDSF